MRARILSAIVMSLSLVSCGGGDPSGAGGGGGGGGGGGRGGGPIRGGFRLTGSVSRTAAVRLAALTSADRTAVGGDTRTASPQKTVTHVMAVNPSSQNLQRAVAQVGADGAFRLDLDPGHPWVLVFIDSSRVGDDMIAGVFRASELDTIAPMMEGGADMGMVEVMEEEQTASAGIAYGDLLAAMNLSDEGADFLGRMDDVCLRYVSPDIDGDGTIDVLQQQHNFMLDFHVQYRTEAAGAGATVADLIGRYLPESTRARYEGVGVYASYATSFASPAVSEMWASFDEPMVYFPSANPMGPVQSRTAAPGQRIPGADLTTLSFSDMKSQGVSAASGHDLPQGRYQFGVGGSQVLTFTSVRTHSDAELASAEDLIMPFLKFVSSDGCTGDCTISSIDYRWMKRTATSWIPASAEEIALVVNDQGGFVSISKGSSNEAQRLMWAIPTSPTTGTIAWGAAMLEGIQAAEAATTKASEICHLGISYDDKLGMRIFSGIQDAPGTCGR